MLPEPFLTRPLAHRGLHDAARGIVENSRAAFEAAIAGGYGIELDVQISGDGVPMVFHDYDLDRLTAFSGPVRDRSAEELTEIALDGSDDRIDRLDTILALIGPRAPVLVEIKDQAGHAGADIGALDQITGRALTKAARDHGAMVAVMSFNPAYIAALDWLPPEIPRGLTTMSADDYSEDLPPEIRAALGDIAAYRAPMSFISHDHRDLDNPRIAELKRQGAAILCWTVRSAQEEARARRIADNVTFEGYRP